MPTSLTSSQIKDTYGQLLHVDGGPTGTEKIVYSGTGVATALNLSTASLSVSNVRLSSSGIAPVSGTFNMSGVNITSGQVTGITDLAVADGGTGASNAADARTNLGLGTMATQDANNVNITGGTITGITDLAVADGGTGASTLTGYVKGNGTAAFTASATVPFADLSGRAYASFYDADTADQTGSTTAATAVEFATAAVAGAGITVASNTRITFAAAGTYRINASLQFNNSGGSDRVVDIWFSKNGTNIANSNARVVIPKTGDGGTNLVAYEIFEIVTAGQYIEIYWYPENSSVTLHYRAAVAASPGVTPAIPATPPAIVVAQRVA